MARMSPLGALVAGAAAGIAGTLTQNVYFRITKKLTPERAKDAKDAVEPAERVQLSESRTPATPRAAVAGIAQPMHADKSRAGRLVHYAYGAAWGELYGASAAAWRAARRFDSGLLFGAGVWALSEGLILPLSRRAAWPRQYPLAVHAHSLGAHLVYGAALSGAFAAIQSAPRRQALAALGARWLTRRWPSPIRPFARRVATRGIDAALRARAVADALR